MQSNPKGLLFFDTLIFHEVFEFFIEKLDLNKFYFQEILTYIDIKKLQR